MICYDKRMFGLKTEHHTVLGKQPNHNQCSIIPMVKHGGGRITISQRLGLKAMSTRVGKYSNEKLIQEAQVLRLGSAFNKRVTQTLSNAGVN